MVPKNAIDKSQIRVKVTVTIQPKKKTAMEQLTEQITQPCISNLVVTIVRLWWYHN